VLFSLGALMAKGEQEAQGAEARDESGLIDIKALAAAAAREPAKAAARPPEVHVDIFPFEAPLPPPPPVNAVAPVEAIGELPVQKASRRGLFIMGALIIGGAAAAIGILLNPTGAPAIAAAESLGVIAESARQGTAAIPPPPAAPSQPEVKSPAPTQNPSRPEVRTPRTASQQTSTANAPQTTPAVAKAETTPAKPPAKDPCGGDLMCAMRRAAEKR
jgi:hypothetical protein